jgi:hypothetical protein
MEQRQHKILPQVINPEIAQNLGIDGSMTKVPPPKRPLGVYLTILWMTINVSMLTYMILTHPDQPHSTIEMTMWIPSIAGLWLMKKWGAALAVAVLCITLGISLGDVLLICGSSTGQLTFVPVNTLRIILNAAASAYLFKCIFAKKFT